MMLEGGVLKILAAFALFLGSCNANANATLETESFFNFIRTLDSKNVLGIEWNQSQTRHPCWHHWINGVECSRVHLRARSITGIRLQSLNLSGVLDAESLCGLPNLHVLILANNQIRGTVPECIGSFDGLMHLDISSNLISGSPPVGLTRMKNLKILNFSDNLFDVNDPVPAAADDDRRQEPGFVRRNRILSDAPVAESVPAGETNSGRRSHPKHTIIWILVAMAVVFLLVIGFFMKLKATQSAKDPNPTPTTHPSSIGDSPLSKIVEEGKEEERPSELVFFVEEKERFGLEELLDATAEWCRKGRHSSLYKVRLKNKSMFAVKRLRKLQVSFEDFGQTMIKIGNLKHPNILSLVGYNSSEENKLLFYRYQRNGSLLSLLENHIEGKNDFTWKLRFSIALGIARGLNFIHHWPGYGDGEIIPHGNIKPSNILLDENLEPLISEYGVSSFLDIDNARLSSSSSSYMAPEKRLSELADVYSYGVIMLELLTGKIAAKQDKKFDLPRWVKARVREEWTGEVFDKEIAKVEMYGFPLLNIALKCVSKLPQDRPSISEVTERIEEVLSVQDDISCSSSPNSCSE